MPSLPPRDNRVLQTVDFFKKEVKAGRLMGALPGEVELSRRLCVSRITLRKALKALEEEKWITPAQPGRRRQTLKHHRQSSGLTTLAAGKTIVTLAPLPLEELPSKVRLDHMRLNSYCARSEITLRHRTLDLSHLKRPAYRLQEFVKQNPADLYFLLLSTRETQRWFSQKRIPCIVLGSAWPDYDLPSADIDQHALGVHAASTLTRLRHLRVGMLYPDPEKRGMQLFVEGMKASAPEMTLVMARQDDSPDSVLRALRSLVEKPAKRPTVLILPRLSYVTTATGLLPSLGLAIPQQLSILCLVHDETLQFIYPRVAGYRVPVEAYPRAIFKLALKLLRHPDTHIADHALIMPDYASGDSLGQASTTVASA